MEKTDLPLPNSTDEVIPKKNNKKLILMVSGALTALVIIITLITVFSTGNLAGISLSNINVELVDAQSGQSIPNTDVKIESDNGVACAKAGCDTNSQTWKGKTNTKGVVIVPSRIINKNTAISATRYGGGIDLKNDSVQDGENWTIELDPGSATSNSLMRIKIIDSKTQKVVPNVSLVITNKQSCTTEGCSDFYFKGTTNKLGNVYYPASTASNKYWISVDGYKTQELKLTWANNKIEVEPAGQL